MKMSKTIATFGVALLASVLSFIMDYNWVEVVNPNVAFMITSIVGMGLRYVTSTPLFKAGGIVKPKEIVK